jgi:hypothetical protein
MIAAFVKSNANQIVPPEGSKYHCKNMILLSHSSLCDLRCVIYLTFYLLDQYSQQNCKMFVPAVFFGKNCVASFLKFNTKWPFTWQALNTSGLVITGVSETLESMMSTGLSTIQIA